MSEARFDMVLQKLRDTAPGAPAALRERVRELREPAPKRRLRLRPALVAIPIVVIGVALIGALIDSSEPRPTPEARFKLAAEPLRSQGATTQSDELRARELIAPGLTSKSRLQQQQVSMQLRVDDLSGATQKAVRETRKLGGYVAAANYSTGESMGDSRLDLRVPAQNVQKAIASFTELGTILAQRISVADLQAGLDRLDARIAAKQKLLETLTGEGSTGATRTRGRLERSRVAPRARRHIREGLAAADDRRSRRPNSRSQAGSRASGVTRATFWGKKLIAVLYALVIVGPFAILAALAFFAERARRRRADHRLLEETG